MRLTPAASKRIATGAALCVSLAASALAASEEVRLEYPAEGATVPERVSFHIAVPGGSALPVASARIELSRDRWKSIDRVWDSSESMRGWTLGDAGHPGRVTYCCATSLGEGPWEWRARTAGPGGEAASSRATSFRVDATPPAEIDELRVQRRPDGVVNLSWDPVVTDVDGKPETVDHYVIYRYQSRGIFSQSPPMRLGQTRAVTYDDRLGRRQTGSGGRASKPADDARTVYYKVVAVDVAGNEIGLREATPSPAAPDTPDR